MCTTTIQPRPLTVQVYRNLTFRGCVMWSIRSSKTNTVITHSTGPFLLNSVAFFVSQPGRDRVRQSGVKGVHAWVNGILQYEPWSPTHEDPVEVFYNPFTVDYFSTRKDNTPLCGAKNCLFLPDGRVLAEAPIPLYKDSD